MIGVRKYPKVSNDRLLNLFHKVVSKSRVLLTAKSRKFRDKRREKPNARLEKAKAIMAAKFRAERAKKKYY